MTYLLKYLRLNYFSLSPSTFLKRRSEYKVHAKIGEGSFSEVLKCQDRHTGNMVAAKQLKKTFRNSTHALELPEVVAMRKITDHPNILHMIDSYFDSLSGKVTLIFELMEMSLYDLMKNRKRFIPEARAKNYLYQIVKGVDHIHHHGIFHRDIKPENILVKGDLLKISDLGSIKGIYTKHPYTEYISTRWYRSPECLLTTGYYGPKMDVWAIGCVFFELLTLKPLFPGSNELDQIAKINNVLGTPSSRLLSKFHRNKGRNSSFCFTPKQGSGLNPLIPLISETGRDIMKQMIVYDPEARINIRRLLEHKYFNDLREAELVVKRFPESTASCVQMGQRNWRNPALLSYLTSEKRHKPKRKLSERRKSGDKIRPMIIKSLKSNKEDLKEASSAPKLGKVKVQATKSSVKLMKVSPSQKDCSHTNSLSLEKHKLRMKAKEPHVPSNTLKEERKTSDVHEKSMFGSNILNEICTLKKPPISSLPMLPENKKVTLKNATKDNSSVNFNKKGPSLPLIPELMKKQFILGYKKTGLPNSTLLKTTLRK